MPATLRRYSIGVVTRIRIRPSCSRWAIGSGPNAENSGVNVHRALSEPERADVEVGNPTGQRRHGGAGAEPVVPECAGESIGTAREHRVGEIDRRVDIFGIAPDPTQRDVVAAPRTHMAVEREVGDVDAACRVDAAEVGPGIVPVESGDRRVVVDEPRFDVRPIVHDENCSSARRAWVA